MMSGQPLLLFLISVWRSRYFGNIMKEDHKNTNEKERRQRSTPRAPMWSCFWKLCVLVRQSLESVPVQDPRLKASIALMHSTDQILALVQQAEALTLEAHGIALKAGDVARGGSGVEGKLYQELKRTMPQPQGIGTLNSAGRVLSWSLMFESQAQVIGFLDHVGERYRETPDRSKPVPAERFMRFPNQKLPTLEDPGTTFDIPHEHAAGEKCPGEPRRAEGAL